jgi:transposase
MKSPLVIGIDVSQLTLDIGTEPASRLQQLANQERSIRSWLRTVPAGSYIGVESTGSYHRCLVKLAIEAGHTVYLLNARDLSHYSRALGRRAKTDQLDAQMIARYLAREHTHLHPYQLPTKAQAQLDELIQRRHTLVKTQVTVRQSFTDAAKPRSLAKLSRAFEAVIEEIDRRIRDCVMQDPTLAPIARNLQTVVGIGPLISSAFANAFTRRPFKNSDAVVAHFGLDPRVRDSGLHRGRRYLSKRGPAELRRLAYVGALSACKTKLWKPIYERYRARGLSSTATLNIIARKLVRIAFSIAQSGLPFNPEIMQTACAKP